MTREEIIRNLEYTMEKHKNDTVHTFDTNISLMCKDILDYLEQEPKTGHCKDCRWWKDSDGAYRRGFDAESRCPMNCKTVFDGNGYCFLFEPKMEGESK